MPFRPASLLLAALIPLFLSGCADSLTTGKSLSRFTDLVRYDKTMTKEEQKAAIAELQEEQARAKQDGKAVKPAATPTESTAPAAKTAQKQN
ncbi:MAG: hypothetical protein ACR2J1_01780 [Methyloceanibacter sp.]|uniref:hypothetical protein n=1 Tax=Methyloceanibacter sp. TaxID=1965321 RepID=UPI003D9AED4F